MFAKHIYLAEAERNQYRLKGQQCEKTHTCLKQPTWRAGGGFGGKKAKGDKSEAKGEHRVSRKSFDSTSRKLAVEGPLQVFNQEITWFVVYVLN